MLKKIQLGLVIVSFALSFIYLLAVLLEIKTDKRLSEQLSLGVSFILNFSNPEIAWYIHIIYI